MTPQNPAVQSGVSDARFARLARGINLPFWFWIGPKTIPEIEARLTEIDFALIRDVGLTAVRLPIDFDILFDERRADLLKPDELAALDRALDKLMAHNLAVIVDIHNTGSKDNQSSVYSGRLEQEPAFLDLFTRFWRHFAAHLSRRDPDLIFPSVLNEPVFRDDPQRWLPMQERLIPAMREGAPHHTLVATAALWAGVDTFIQLQPLPDPNLIYDFHFYEPHVFTHQGATWGEAAWKTLRDVPYPADQAVIERQIEAAQDAAVRHVLQTYGEQHWDQAKIAQRLELVVQWAKRHNVRVICGEFGVYIPNTPPQARARWLTDVRTALEQSGISWFMWDYDHSFGLVRRQGEQRILDPNVVTALGLGMAVGR